MKVCPYCGHESGAIGGGGDLWDYCHWCERSIEGQTVDLHEYLAELAERDDLPRIIEVIGDVDQPTIRARACEHVITLYENLEGSLDPDTFRSACCVGGGTWVYDGRGQLVEWRPAAARTWAA